MLDPDNVARYISKKYHKDIIVVKVKERAEKRQG
jgi:hypothetical protein